MRAHGDDPDRWALEMSVLAARALRERDLTSREASLLMRCLTRATTEHGCWPPIVVVGVTPDGQRWNAAVWDNDTDLDAILERTAGQRRQIVPVAALIDVLDQSELCTVLGCDPPGDYLPAAWTST